MNEKIIIKVKRISTAFNDIPLPAYATADASGMDIRAAVENTMSMQPGAYALIPTNLSVEIPSGYEMQVRPRSGLAAKHGVTVLNSPGTIDADYRGEVKIILINHGQEQFEINRGDRIAQLVIARVHIGKFIEVTDLKESTRSDGGFGHTGRI